MIQKSSFWKELLDAKVFDETPDAPDVAKQGKEIFAFEPLAFLQNFNQMERNGLKGNKKESILKLIRLVRTQSKDKWSNEECCKALSAVFYNRLHHDEWSACSDFTDFIEDATKTPEPDEQQTMLPWIADVVMHDGWSELPHEYVHFHADSETIDSQPWDVSVLDQENTKKLGGFTFYKYIQRKKNFATELTIKELKLVGGGSKGESIPCSPGETLMRKGADGKNIPYRYDIKNPATWEFEFTFTIPKGTPAQEDTKKTVSWTLKYQQRVPGKKVEEKNEIISTQGNRFSFPLPTNVDDYTVELIPCYGKNHTELDDPITIYLRKREHLLFNGKTIRWITEDGEHLEFEANPKPLNALVAYSGSPSLQAPNGQDKDEDGPIPVGNYWIDRSNIETTKSVFWYLYKTDLEKEWPGGVDKWGESRILLEPDKDTDLKGRKQKFYIRGGKDPETDGNITVHREGQGYFDMAVLAFNITKRVPGKVLFKVDYRNLKLGPNEIYREYIMFASDRTGLDPAIIAAVINTEAAAMTAKETEQLAIELFNKKHPELDENLPGKTDPLFNELKSIIRSVEGAWNPNSYNEDSHALGLTQFVPSTWEDQAKASGTYLNEHAKGLGFVTPANTIVPACENELMELRKKPMLSIVAAAEYDKSLYDGLVNDGVFPKDEPLVDMAHHLYICHHEGPKGVKQVLGLSEFDESTAKYRLSKQVGGNQTTMEYWKNIGKGKWADGYRKWLFDLVDKRVNPLKFQE